MRAIAQALPKPIKRQLRQAYMTFRDAPLRWGNDRFCPVCNKPSKQFRSFGRTNRVDAQCVRCGSLERHRLVWLYFQKKTDLFDQKPKKMLHFAPERCFVPQLTSIIGDGYITADLYADNAMVKMDVTEIRYPDASFDVLYCSHVLEHVVEDRKALREFHRVLKPQGWAMILVPAIGDKTQEDLSITDPAMRLRLYGQRDHVRLYGLDFADRLRETGFNVTTVAPTDFLTAEDIIRMGITKSAGVLFYCTK